MEGVLNSRAEVVEAASNFPGDSGFKIYLVTITWMERVSLGFFLVFDTTIYSERRFGIGYSTVLPGQAYPARATVTYALNF